jgi:hypothetical protein
VKCQEASLVAGAHAAPQESFFRYVSATNNVK